jgi:hypothetical protein
MPTICQPAVCDLMDALQLSHTSWLVACVHTWHPPWGWWHSKGCWGWCAHSCCSQQHSRKGRRDVLNKAVPTACTCQLCCVTCSYLHLVVVAFLGEPLQHLEV